MIKKYGDVASGIFLVLFSVALFTASLGIKTLSVTTFGAGFFPQVVAVLLFFTSLAIISGGIKTMRTHKPAEGAAEGPKDKVPPAVVTLTLIVAYVALVTVVGFMLSTALYLFAQMFVLAHKEERNYVLFGIISVVTAVVVYYLFGQVFHLMLPAGHWGLG